MIFPLRHVGVRSLRGFNALLQYERTHVMDTFDSLARANPEYVEALYRRYREDPRSVDESWALVFAGYGIALAAGSSARATARTSPPVADLVHSSRDSR